MKVKNRRCIRKLSYKQFRAAKTRNLIAVCAIALTTLLFTTLFTIALSLNASYQEYSFRQAGGYGHGTFKELDEEKIQALSAHKKVKEYGLRTVCGYSSKPPFAKIGAEVSWMDENCAKWSYISLDEGHLPEKKNEIIMDTAALAKLGVPAKLGEQVELTYALGTDPDAPEQTDVFTLCGYWKYDELIPVHYLNVSKEYVDEMERVCLEAGGEAFRTDMDVMLATSIDIRGEMERIDTDLGYQWENREADNCVRIGVNWGYTASELDSNIDPLTVIAIAAVLILVILTGYLIIYNIFQISVSNDIRFYGLLKTIGTTPRQLKRIVRWQALYLSAIGIPIGCVLGYGIGAVLVPVVLSTTGMGTPEKISVSPMIFLGAILFSLATVWLSCSRPGRRAAAITPVEAVRYTENSTGKKKKRATRGTKIRQMAFANLGRNRTKTFLVVVSLSLSLVLLNALSLLVGGFDREKYLEHFSASDFVVGTPGYFNLSGSLHDNTLSEETLWELQEHTDAALEGTGTMLSGNEPMCWISEKEFRDSAGFLPEEWTNAKIDAAEKRGELLLAPLLLEGLSEPLFTKLKVYEGSLKPLSDPAQKAIAVAVMEDDYGNPQPYTQKPGDLLTVTYVDEAAVYDTRTGTLADGTTPDENRELRTLKSHDVTYTICAVVAVPDSISFRYANSSGLQAVLTNEALQRDSEQSLLHVCYVFDAKDEAGEEAAEQFLAEYTKGEDSGLAYESKALLRGKFEDMKNMFSLMGGMLCVIVGVVGILNFFNAIMTGILTRQREFAMLQSVGMTGKQLKQMLVLEGVFYAAAAGVVSLLLSILLNPLLGKLFGGMFWFFTYRFTVLSVLAVVPVFVLLGVLLPLLIYKFTARKSIVERLRETE